MKKIITLAVLGLSVAACDPFNKQASGTPEIMYAMVTGRSYGPRLATNTSGTWTVSAIPGAVGSSGRMVVVTANQLLDGASIEAEPADVNDLANHPGCSPANNWLTVTTTATMPAGGKWYTCYYPSAATVTDGASVMIFYSTTPPGVATAAAPNRSGAMPIGNYTFRGTVKTADGADLPIAVDASIGTVAVAVAATTTTPGGAAVVATATLGNWTAADLTWEATAVDQNGDPVDAGFGTIAPTTGSLTTTYTPPAALPTGVTKLVVSVKGTAKGISASKSITVQ